GSGVRGEAYRIRTPHPLPLTLHVFLELIMEPTEIGKIYRRLDYETKVTGRAQYLADMSMPGMCHGRILRSPFPHARIKRIDAAKAAGLPGRRAGHTSYEL